MSCRKEFILFVVVAAIMLIMLGMVLIRGQQIRHEESPIALTEYTRYGR